MQTLEARAIDVNTVNGDVRIDRLVGRPRAHPIARRRSRSAGQPRQGRALRNRIALGRCRLALAEQPGFELEAHTFNGRIRVDFPIKSEGPVRDSDRGPRSVRGTYGDGSSSLRVQTFNGNLTITRRWELTHYSQIGRFADCEITRRPAGSLKKIPLPSWRPLR